MKHSGTLMDGRRIRWAALTCAVATLMTTACSDEPVVAEGPYADEVRAALAVATSDYEREVLADGVVTRDEYTEALDRWVTCMADFGITAGLQPQDGYFIYSISGGSFDKEYDTCHARSVGGIESIYIGMLENPENRPWPDALRDCLVAAGLVDASASAAELSDQVGAIAEGTSALVDNDNPAAAECANHPFASPAGSP